MAFARKSIPFAVPSQAVVQSLWKVRSADGPGCAGLDRALVELKSPHTPGFPR
jgi:hypothetical protein